MVLAIKAGLDPAAVAAALNGGAARSWVLENRTGRMIDNAYPLGFRTSLHLKDLAIALELARSTGTALPVSALCAALESGLVARGYGDEDVSNVARAIRSLSGLDG
jgi:3-hydroxyisobutyrate dehydrogenase